MVVLGCITIPNQPIDHSITMGSPAPRAASGSGSSGSSCTELSCEITVDTPPKSNIDTKNDGLEMYLRSNMVILDIYIILDIYVRFQGVSVIPIPQYLKLAVCGLSLRIRFYVLRKGFP